jgi:hypothetical protein
MRQDASFRSVYATLTDSLLLTQARRLIHSWYQCRPGLDWEPPEALQQFNLLPIAFPGITGRMTPVVAG